MSDDRSDAMPDSFDRQLGQLDGLNETLRTAPRTLRVVPLLGVGGTETFIVQTVRQKDLGDTVFLEHVRGATATRIVLPPKVTAALAQQTAPINGMSRRKGARAAVETRKERGITPAFLKPGAKKGRRKK